MTVLDRIRSLVASKQAPSSAELGELAQEINLERIDCERQLQEMRGARRALLVVGSPEELREADSEIEAQERLLAQLVARLEEVSRRRRHAQELERVERMPALVRALEDALQPLDGLASEYRLGVENAQKAAGELCQAWHLASVQGTTNVHDFPQIPASVSEAVARHLSPSTRLPVHPGPRPDKDGPKAVMSGDGVWEFRGVWSDADRERFFAQHQPRSVRESAGRRALRGLRGGGE